MGIPIEFGTAFRSPFEIADSAKYIEKLGFDILGCGEHVSFHGDTANAFISLSVAAGVTSKIKLMSTITLVPLYPAALLAKMGAALDVASEGRFICGVGVGGEYPPEFEACGVPVKERGSRTDEALEIVQRLWSSKNVTYKGKYADLNNISMKPMPIQKPRPPIWVSGRKDVAMKRAAKFADGWLPYMYTPEQMAQSVEKIKQFGEELGKDMSGFRYGLYIFTAVHDDNDTAIKMASDRLSIQYNQDFSKIVHKYALAGDPDRCIQRLKEYIDAGASFIFVSSACPDEYIAENLERIAHSVIPAFRPE